MGFQYVNWSRYYRLRAGYRWLCCAVLQLSIERRLRVYADLYLFHPFRALSLIQRCLFGSEPSEGLILPQFLFPSFSSIP